MGLVDHGYLLTDLQLALYLDLTKIEIVLLATTVRDFKNNLAAHTDTIDLLPAFPYQLL